MNGAPSDTAVPHALITGLILAGGRATRMGQVDKGLQSLAGAPLVAHAIARLAPQVGPLAININRNHALYAPFGLPLWPDLNTEYAGPLAGLQAGMRQCATPYLLSVPCDSPFLPLDLASRLWSALQTSGADLAVAATLDDKDDHNVRPSRKEHTGQAGHNLQSGGGDRSRLRDGPDGGATQAERPHRLHPVFCLLKTTLQTQLNAYIDGGGRKMQSWMKSQAMVEVFFDDAAAFSNINTLQELQRFEQHPP